MISTALPNPLAAAQYRLGLLTLVVSTSAINILSLTLPIVTLQIYDRVLHSHNLGTLQMLAIGVAIAVGFEMLLRVLRAHLVCYRGASYAHGLSCAAMNAQLDASIASSRTRALASELAAFNSIKSMKEFGSGSALIIMIDLMFLPLFIAVMANISHTLVLVPFGLLCAFALITAAAGLGVRRQLDRTSQADDQRYDFLIDSLTSIQLLKSHASEKLVQRRFEKLHRESCHASYDLSRSITQSFVHGSVLSHVMTVATVAAGAYMAIAGDLTIGALIAVVQLSSRLMQPVQKSVLLWLKYQDYQSAQQRAGMLFDVPAVREVETCEDVRNEGRVDIIGLSYRFTPGSPLLLDDINLNLSRGETLILDGAPGSGKTTLLKLIAGIYASSSGRIRINDADIDAMTPQQRAKCIAFLSPRATMFRGTIRDNITRFGQIPLAQALDVAALLGLSNEFSRLPRGIDTLVGPGNETSLTPGLTQMVAIARALACKPRVILFDNADTGLDHHYYNKLFEVMGRLRPSVAMIIVSRDLNVRQLGHRQATLAEGRLISADSRQVRTLRPEARL